MMGVTFNSGDGATPVQQKLYAQAINYLSHYTGMGEILRDLATMDVNIRFIYNGQDSYDSANNTIFWDPTSALNVIQANGQVGAQSAALGLFHEICHWLYAHTGNPAYAEASATYIEGKAAISLGEPVRLTYDASSKLNTTVVVTNPTAHTGGGYWQAVDANGNPVQGPAYDPNATVVAVPGGAAAGGGSGGGGEHGGGTGGVPGGSTGSGTGGTGTGGTGGTGGGYWRPVAPHSVSPDPYHDAAVSHDASTVVVVGVVEHIA